MAAPHVQGAFPYNQLEDTDIRILRIEPGTGEDVTCYLHHATLDQSLYYDALSYFWGDASTRREIKVNGLIFLVTENLYTALKRLRSISPEGGCAAVFFWIDAICINQDDPLERSRQVPRMDRIYANASRVFIWISPAELNRDAALQEATRRVRDLFRPDKARWWQQQLLALRTSTMDESAVPRSVLRDLVIFQNHPWFHRLWTLQESVLARRSPVLLFEDDDAFDDSCEVFTLNALYNKVIWRPPSMQLIANLIELRKWVQKPELLAKMSMHNPGYMILMILRRSELKAMSVPQDRLYGIYGILSAVSSQFPGLTLPQVDYTLPPFQVFGQFARYIIETTGSTCLLDCALFDWRILRGPTWVSMFHCMPKAFLKTGPTNPSQRPNISADGSVLTIKGVFKDRCVVVLRPSDPVEFLQVKQYVTEVEDKVIQPVASHRNLDLKAVRETLFPFPTAYDTYEYYRLRTGIESGDERPNVLVGKTEALWQIMSPIFVTSLGSFGLCHKFGPCSVGDYICLRPKGVPLIIRKQDSFGGMYEVIGPVVECSEDLRDQSGLALEDVCLV